MGSNTKWIECRRGDAVSDVARRALKRHLNRMWRYLELAVSQSPEAVENVHQLRVFSRRAAAAMDTFSEYLPTRDKAWLARKLRKIRKAAGAARDLDVLRLRWADYARHNPSSQAAVLVEQLRRRRHDAQEPITRLHARLVRNDFSVRRKKVLKRFRAPKRAGECGDRFECFAHRMMARLIEPYVQAAREPLDDASALHQFRIQSKRIRYAMEILGGAFDEDFRKVLYPLVANLQDRLGAINDHVTAQTFFAAWHAQTDSPAIRAALELGMEVEQRGLETHRKEFFEAWTSERREELCAQLARYASTAPRPE